jgi:hypothetical protein
MNNISPSNEQTNEQQVFTRAEVENIIREFERTKIQEQEERYNRSELPLAILEALDNSSTGQLKENFKSYKRSIHKYNHDKWTRPEQVNKEFIPDLKNWKVDAYQLVTTIYKITETTRLQTRASTELYEQLQYLSTRTAFNSNTDREIFLTGVQQAERLAVFGFGSAKFQEQEAKEVTLKTLKLPASVKHLESSTEDDGRSTRDAFDLNFVEQIVVSYPPR